MKFLIPIIVSLVTTFVFELGMKTESRLSKNDLLAQRQAAYDSGVLQTLIATGEEPAMATNKVIQFEIYSTRPK